MRGGYIKLGEVLDLEKASNEVSGSSGVVLDLVQKAWAKQKLLKILPNVQTKVQTKVYLSLTNVWTKVLTKFHVRINNSSTSSFLLLQWYRL